MITLKKLIAKGLLFLAIFIGLSYITGCSESEEQAQNVAFNEETRYVKPVELYVRQTFTLGKYEPLSGFYAGAYVEDDHNIKGSIKTYEEVVGQEQTFKVLQYRQEAGLESNQILECISEKKIPYIKILLEDDYSINSIYKLVYDLKSSYETTVFIELYPLTTKAFDAASYIETYQKAYSIIHQYLKDAVIVWSVDEDRVYDSAFYYPGNDYVDWAGINIYIPRYKQNEKYTFAGEEAIDFWYKSFQKVKPMLISSLAISNYSRVDHTYGVYEAEAQLKYFYHDLLKAYPRIRSILYIDVDMWEISRGGKEDYRLTSQSVLQDTMKQLTEKLKLLTRLEDETGKARGYMKYTVEGSFFNDQLYLEEDYVKKLFKNVSLSKLRSKRSLSGTSYYAFSELEAYADCYYEE